MLRQLYDPSSADYRHFLSVEEFTNEFAPTAEDYQKVAEFARDNGFTVNGSAPNRLVVSISGTAGQIERTFNVRMRTYQHPTETREFYSPDREPSIPSGLAVYHITGLNNYSLPMSLAKRSPAGMNGAVVQGSGPGNDYMPSDMRAAYYGGTALTGRGQTLGLVQFDGYDIADVISTFYGEATLSKSGSDSVVNYTPPNSKTTYAVKVHNVLLNGATGAPGQLMPPADDAEQVLDIAQSIGMAPGLSQVRVYIGSNDVDILSAIASENLANEVSISWAWMPEDPSAVDQYFEEMAAQGQSVFVASGDYGAYSPNMPYYFPAEDQWVTAVGGTDLTTNGPGGSLLSETAWNQSGGGISPDAIPIPSWQAGIANSSNNASNTLRNVPDVAMEADFDNFDCNMGYCEEGWAGTSFASPRWAAYTALINQQAAAAGDPPVGFLNPYLYRTGQSSSYGTQFHDIDSGESNFYEGYGFYAIPGYDLITGWGSPAGQNLINALAPQSSTAGFVLTTTQSALTIDPGSSATTTVGVTDVGGFAGSVSLAVTSTLPSGVTASFNPISTRSTSVLTISASPLAQTQSFVMMVVGAAAGASQEFTYVTVNIPTDSVVIQSPTVPAVPVLAELLKPSTPIPVKATILGQPKAIQLSWAPGMSATSGWSTAGISLNLSSGPPYSHATIGTWDTTAITAAGYYTIQVSATYAQGTVSATTLVYLEPDLFSSNWPRLLDLTPDFYSGIIPVDGSNGRAGGLGLIEPHYANTTEAASYHILSLDGSSDESVGLTYGTCFSPSFGPLTPGQSGESVVADGRTLYAIADNGTPTPFSSSELNGDLNFSQVVLADLKGDSSLATVAYAIQTWKNIAYVIALDPDGKPASAKFPIQVPYENTQAEFAAWNQGVIVGDVNGVGEEDIIALESSSASTFTLRLFANDGSPMAWKAPTFAGNPGPMMLVDLDGNGMLETVIAARNASTGDGAVHVLQPDGSERKGWPVALPGNYLIFLAAGDLARKGMEQIVISSGVQIYVLNGDGTSFSSAWPLTTNTFSLFGAPVLADIDGDGYPEILAASGNYSFPQDSGKLTTTRSSAVRTGSGRLALPQAQVNLASNSTDGYFAPVLFAFHRDGTVVRSWNLLGMNGEQPFYFPRITVGDFNHEGKTDIAIVNGLIFGGGASGYVTQGMVEVLTTGAPFQATANDWPMMNHDPYNSAVAYPAGANSPQAMSPVFGPSSGTYSAALTAIITDATPNATIYYTLDGSAPTTNSIEYSGPITVNSSETIEAIAVATGYWHSSVVSAAYSIGSSVAAPPSFGVAAGTYTSAQSVSISDSTPGAVIYYTTNGTTPTTTSTPYSGAVTVSTSETLKAVAIAGGYSQSAVASATYTINLPAAVPAFSVAAGTYTSVQAVAISDSISGAAIYYTIGNSTPTTGSIRYSGPIIVSKTETIQAIATASGHLQSPVASAGYTIELPAATPAFNVEQGTYTSPQTVTISDSMPGDTIHYTTNGTAPTASSTAYSAPIKVAATETLEAIAVETGYSNSAVASAKYTLVAGTPTFTPAAGTYTSPQTVTISDSTPGVTIHYTTNGTAPTASSTVYSAPIKVAATETLQVIAVETGYSNSPVASAKYTLVAATPTFTPAAGTYSSPRTVTISDSTPGVTIHYTTNGTAPTASSTAYSAPIKVAATETLQAIAVETGYSSSAVASARYTLVAATLTFTPAAGTYTSPKTVTISDSTPGVTIHYTTNGTAPTASSTAYSAPIKVATTETLRAMAVETGYSNSAVASAKYTMIAATPTFTPAAGTYTSPKTVTISDSTPGGTIHYTTNGTAPTASSTVYSAPIKVATTETLRAMAVETGYSNSAVASAKYTLR